MFIYSAILSVFISIIILNLLNFQNKIYSNKGVISVTGLRCFLCLSVAISHSIHLLYTKNNEWIYDKNFKLFFGWDNFYLTSGKIGVLMFFMISGFLFYRIVYRENFNYFSFIKKRIYRIVPMYWFSFFIILLTAFISLSPTFNISIIVDSIKWMLFIGNGQLGDIRTSSINAGVEWTLKLEWILYLSVLFLAIFTKSMSNRKKDLLIIFSIILILAIAAAIRIYTSVYTDPRPVLGFATGFLAYRLQSHLFSLKENKKASIFALVVIVISLFICVYSFYYILFLFLCSIFFLVVSCGNDLFKILSNRTVVSIGEVSYSIYLIHGIVLFIMNEYFVIYFPSSFFGSLFFNVLFIIATCYISKLTYLLIEKKWI